MSLGRKSPWRNIALATLAALMLGIASGCGGLHFRLGVGPTIDSDGHVGVEVVFSQGMRVSDSPVWLASAVAGGYNASTDKPTVAVFVGSDYRHLPRMLGAEHAGDSAPSLERGGDGLGYRLGPRLGYRDFGNSDDYGAAYSGGASAALSYPVGHLVASTVTAGIELHCELLIKRDAAGEGRVPRARCAAPLTLEILNAWRPLRTSY